MNVGRQQQRVSVGGRSRDKARRDRRVAARSVVDQHLHAEHRRQSFGNQPRHDVGAATGRERHHETNGLARKLRRPRMGGGDQGECGQEP